MNTHTDTHLLKLTIVQQSRGYTPLEGQCVRNVCFEAKHSHKKQNMTVHILQDAGFQLLTHCSPLSTLQTRRFSSDFTV